MTATTLPKIPNSVSIGAEIDITWSTVVNVSEGGIAGRESLHDQAMRNFHLTIGPDDVAEVRAIYMACLGQRYPCVVRDWSDYTFTDQICTHTVSSGATLVQLSKTLTPSAGSRTFTQNILYPDTSSIALSFKINDVAFGGTATVQDFGIVSLNTVVSTGAVVKASGQYLVPCCFMQDMMTIKAVTADILSIQDVQLREIFAAELANLIT